MTPEDLESLFGLRGRIDENALIRRFRDWVRQLPPPAP
jgi:hypothetical protein